MNILKFPLREKTNNYIVGPFFSVDLVNLYNFKEFNFINMFYFGIMINTRYGPRNSNSHYNYSFSNLELGFKYNNNMPSIYFGIKISYFVPALVIAYLLNPMR